MTELEKLRSARTYIDSLSKGISPVNGEKISENDIVMDPDVSKWLVYASGVLKKVIANGGTAPLKKSKPIKKIKNSQKVPFDITAEQLKKFPYSEKPISVSEIARNINTLIDTNTMRSIAYTDITNWLISFGVLYEAESIEGKIKRQPTDKGTKLGISTELREKEGKSYTIVVYNADAQKYIIKNMDKILEMKNKQ